MNPTSQTELKEFKKGMGLKFKFSVAIIFLIAIIMGLVTLVVREQVRESLLGQVREKGFALARGLAGNASEAMVVADRLALSDLVDKAIHQEKGILQAALIGSNNVTLAHSDFKMEGQPYFLPADAVVTPSDQGRMINYFLQGQEVLDFEAPIVFSGKNNTAKTVLGAAHVVYSLAPIRRVVTDSLQKLFTIAALGLILGILFALVLVNRITRPVRKLAKAADEIGTGNLDLVLDVRGRDELGQLAHTFNHMTSSLKKAQAELIVKERLQHEMEIAQHIQNLLVPKESPKIPGYSLGMLYRAAEEVSGDYFDFLDLGKGHWGMVIADVSGKGVPGALVMAQTRSVMRSVAVDSVSPMKVLSRTNLMLHGDLRDDMFVTVSYMVLDTQKRVATLSRAGHLAAIIFRKATQSCELEMPTGIAVGISDPDTFDLMLNERKVKLEPGDFVLLYTDGVDEACNRAQELFGSERLLKTIIKASHLRAEGIIDFLDRTIRAFVGDAPQHDDMTMILVKVDEAK